MALEEFACGSSYAGPKGSVGEHGGKGSRGRLGKKGSCGAPGHDGAKGYQGPMGPMGPKGDKGIKGKDKNVLLKVLTLPTFKILYIVEIVKTLILEQFTNRKRQTE